LIRISVVIPVYKVEKYLRKCVDSVLGQSYPLHEIILVDDGSPDGCPAICDEYAAAYPDRIKVVHQENRGLSGARNTGIEIATGDYLGFIDSDDYIEPDMYEALAGAVEKSGADIAVGGVWVEDEYGGKYSRHEIGKDSVWTRDEALIELNSFGRIGISTWDKLYKKELFRELRFPPVLYEDNFIMYKLFAECERVANVSKPLYHYIQRAGSISRNSGEVSLLPLEAYRQQLTFFREKFPEIVYAAETAYVFAHIAIYNLYARKGLRCERKLTAMLRRESRKYIAGVFRNARLPVSKKLQAAVFCVSLAAYRFVVVRRGHR